MYIHFYVFRAIKIHDDKNRNRGDVIVCCPTCIFRRPCRLFEYFIRTNSTVKYNTLIKYYNIIIVFQS